MPYKKPTIFSLVAFRKKRKKVRVMVAFMEDRWWTTKSENRIFEWGGLLQQWRKRKRKRWWVVRKPKIWCLLRKKEQEQEGVLWLSQRKVFQLLLTFISLGTNVLSVALPTTSAIESYNVVCSHFKMRGKGDAPFPDISTWNSSW